MSFNVKENKIDKFVSSLSVEVKYVISTLEREIHNFKFFEG